MGYTMGALDGVHNGGPRWATQQGPSMGYTTGFTTGGGVSKILGEGIGGTPAQKFKFWLKSISGRFSKVMVKCELILINFRGRNY